VGIANDVNKKIAQGCQGGTRRILAVGTLYYYFQPKNQVDSPAMFLLDYFENC